MTFLASDAASYITGEIVFVDVGWMTLNYTVPGFTACGFLMAGSLGQRIFFTCRLGIENIAAHARISAHNSHQISRDQGDVLSVASGQ